MLLIRLLVARDNRLQDTEIPERDVKCIGKRETLLNAILAIFFGRQTEVAHKF
jgi:hypothetical protein